MRKLTIKKINDALESAGFTVDTSIPEHMIKEGADAIREEIDRFALDAVLLGTPPSVGRASDS